MLVAPGVESGGGASVDMADGMELNSAPSDSSMPSFVQPSGAAETEHFKELWRLCRALGGGERCTEDTWRALGWLPHGDELGSGKRRDKARNARLTLLGKARKKLVQELSTQEQSQEQLQEQQLTDEQRYERAVYLVFDELSRDPACRQELQEDLANELQELQQERRMQTPPTADHSACSTHTCEMQRTAFLYQHGVQPCPVRYSLPVLFEPSCEAEFELLLPDLRDCECSISLSALAARVTTLRETLSSPLDEEELYQSRLWEYCCELFRHAQRLAELMRDVLLPNGQPILQPEARYELKYVAAALALRCGLFHDAQGSPSRPAAAAAMNSMVSDEPLSKNASERVKSWLNKLQHLEQAYLDASADGMLSKVAAATRFLEEGRVTDSTGGEHMPRGLMHKQYVQHSQIVLRSRVKPTSVYDLMERRVVGGPYDWGTESVAVPAYLLDR